MPADRISRALSAGFLRAFSVGISLVLAAGCSSGDDDAGDDFGKELEGVYAIETWTENASACDVEGPDTLASQTDKKLAIRHDKFVIPFIVVATCTDLDDCANSTAGSIFSALGGGATLEKKTADGYTTEGGELIWSRTSTGCSGLVVEPLLTSLGESRVAFRTSTYKFADVPFDTKNDQGEDDCSAKSLRQAAKDAGCVKLDVITATREADIPPKPSS
jgi:hypothetical protein